MKIANVKVYGLEESMVASGYPMRINCPNEIEMHEEIYAIKIGLSTKRINTCKNLGSCNSGEAEDNFLKGIIVQYDLTMNHIMIPQFMRYHFHDFISSQSKMHRITSMKLKECCGKRVKQDIINSVQEEIDKYLLMIAANKSKEDNIARYSKENIQEQYEIIMENLPLGLELTARITDNYLQLKTKYFQRYKHKMSFWREYCKWILTLPGFDELTNCKTKTHGDD